MAWVKLDDSMPLHPKSIAAGVDGFALDVAGIAYCNRYKTNGFVATKSLPAVFPVMENPTKVAGKLVSVGRWSRVSGGYQIHDYLDYQPSKAHVEDVSVKRAAAGRVGGSRSKPEPNGKQIASTSSNPVPSRPVLKASTSFDAFNAARAVEAVALRKKAGLPVKSETGLAKTIQQDIVFRGESERLWAHRDCSSCRGKGFTEAYAPGAGTRQIQCEEVV